MNILAKLMLVSREDQVLVIELTRIGTETTELIEDRSCHAVVSSVIGQHKKSNCSHKFVDSNSGSSKLSCTTSAVSSIIY